MRALRSRACARRSDNCPLFGSAQAVSRPRSGERSERSLRHGRALPQNPLSERRSRRVKDDVHSTGYERTLTVCMSPSSAQFSTPPLSPAFPVQRRVDAAAVCRVSRSRSSKDSARRSIAVSVTGQRLDKLGVSDPGDRAGSRCRGGPWGRSRPVPCSHARRAGPFGRRRTPPGRGASNGCYITQGQ